MHTTTITWLQPGLSFIMTMLLYRLRVYYLNLVKLFLRHVITVLFQFSGNGVRVSLPQNAASVSMVKDESSPSSIHRSPVSTNPYPHHVVVSTPTAPRQSCGPHWPVSFKMHPSMSPKD